MNILRLPAALLLLGLSAASAQSLGDLQSLRGHGGPMMPTIGSPILSGLNPGGTDIPASLQEQNGLFETVDETQYIIGPGDFLVLGMGTRTTTLPVNPEGMLVIENVGPVQVGDKTLVEVKKVVIAALSRVYKGDRIFVTLGKVKRIQVSVVGAVVNPGVYVTGGGSRLSEALNLAGGAAPTANKKFTIADRKGKVSQYDLDGYFRGNDLTQNPYLSAGDQVRAEEVDFAGTTVQIRENEQVATLQLKQGQSAFDLVGGYYRIRKPRNWDFLRVYEEGQPPRDISKREAQTYAPRPNAVIELMAYKPLVFVSGAVGRPASYDFNVNFNALDYVSTAGIITISGNYDELEVIGADGKVRWVDSSKDKILPGDHIIVPQSKESRVRDYIGLLVSVASIVSSIVLTVVTINAQNNN